MLRNRLNKLLFMIILSTLVANGLAIAQTFEVPPTSSTYSNVPYISDEAMEQCVVLYNEAKWLEQEISNTVVDQYSQASVNSYNAKVSRHSSMINTFNRDCAGKQSESAYRAAQKLNGKNQ